MFYLYLLLSNPNIIKIYHAIFYTIFLLAYIKLGLMFSPEDITSGILYMANEQDMEITRLSNLCIEAQSREYACK